MTGAPPHYYRIGAVCLTYGLHEQTLRRWERLGLLVPAHRTVTGDRRYTDADLRRLETILALTRDRKVNLSAVEVILALRDKVASLTRQVEGLLQKEGH